MKRNFVTIVLLSVFCLVACDKHNDALCSKLKNSEREKAFRLENNLDDTKINKVSVYVENSGSMDGYVAGNTEFKTDIFNILCKLNSESSINKVEKFFVNDDAIPMEKISDEKFSRDMNAAIFKQSGGNRSTSDIALTMKEKVILPTKNNDVSIFISDCVFSPSNGEDIHKLLDEEKTIIETALSQKQKKNKNFGVTIYRLMSMFNGFYYNKTGAPISLSEPRPYFVWVFGNFSSLKRINSVLYNTIGKKAGAYIYTTFAPIDDIPYYSPAASCNKNRGKHIHEPKVKNGEFAFSVNVDFSSVPLEESYIMDTKNYSIDNKAYSVVKIEKSTKEGYTHSIKVILNSKKSIKDATVLTLSVKRPDTPKWVAQYDDSVGDDYMKTPYKKNRTFGLKAYVEGARDAYSGDMANFKILIK